MKTEQELRLIALEFAMSHKEEKHEKRLEIAEAYFQFLLKTTSKVNPLTIP